MHLLQRSSAILPKEGKMKELHFTQKVLTGQQNFILIGLPLIIEKIMIFSLAMEYFLIMSHQEEAKLL